MITKSKDIFLELKKIISKEKKIASEMSSVVNSSANSNQVISHINSLKLSLKQENKKITGMIESMMVSRGLGTNANEKTVNEVIEKTIKKPKEKNFIEKFEENRKLNKQFKISKDEQTIVKRLEKKKKEEIIRNRPKKPNVYAGIASRFFSNISRSIVENKSFKGMIDDLLKTNLGFVPSAYVSIIFLSVSIAFIFSVLIFLFLLFFTLTSTPPFIAPVTNMVTRFLEIFWIPAIIPGIVFAFLYVYPSMERKSLQSRIDQELPFATINMSAIAGSKIEPTNIFNIIISTGEYPYLKKQFTKLMNEINIYGHDMVTALGNSADTCPSKKLADLYNSLATNITSGGDLSEFFDKRSESLLLDYRLERERYTHASETFIDVYISLVIAAPMILMLLLMMIQVSGLGLSLSAGTISLIMVLGVAGMNLVFLMFLQLKQPSQ